MSGFSNTVLGGASTLIRKAIQSPNYVLGLAGWSIKRDGSAEFNNLTLRGSFFGTNFIISADGVFLYSGTPALGNLIISLCSTNTTDSVGNAVEGGVSTYFVSGGLNLCLNYSGGLITLRQSLGSGYAAIGVGLDFSQTPVGKILVSGKLVAVDPSTGLEDPWHNVTPPAGFTAGVLRYKLEPDNSLHIQCNLTVASSVASGTVTLFTLPVGWRPSVSIRPGIPGMFTNSPTTVAQLAGLLNQRIAIGSGGGVQVLAFAGGAVGTGVTEVDFDVTIPMD